MITDVPGVLVGHWSDPDAATGCTVVLFPPQTVGARHLAGMAPATRETDVLRPENLVSEVHGVVLSGGSAFGLATADGVMEFLAARGAGVAFGGATVPIVPAAAIFDLGIGSPDVRPGPDEGRAACEAASAQSPEGSVGAGTGATVGKWAGAEHAVKGGLGSASVRAGDLVVGALVVCNAAGDVVDEDGTVIAGSSSPSPEGWPSLTGQSTVLVCVATNARLDKVQATQVARMASAGVSRAVRPAHTPYDGDILFVAATGPVPGEPAVVGALGADVVAAALRRGVRAATTVAGVPAPSQR